MKKIWMLGLCASALIGSANLVQADSSHSIGNAGYQADEHAPIGVMGDHMHKKGEWMVSYRFMRMNMEDNRNGTDNLSPEDIVTNFSNPFFGTPGQPANLRVVPLEMTTDMHMFGTMYAPSDIVTLMAMANYIDRDMDHVTFMGGAGTTRLGEFTTKVRGWGDTKVGSLIRLHEDKTHHVHMNAMVSLPTGSIKKEDNILTPMGMRPQVRLPYAMQLGSGTYDLLPGITYTGKNDQYGWGAQYNATLRLGENDASYTLGNKQQLSVWGSYSFTPAVSASLRITGETEGKIDGQDARIVAPVQTADPDNYGGRRISTSLGLNAVVPKGALAGHRFSAELTLPVYQNLNGPQMKRDSAVVLGWSKSF